MAMIESGKRVKAKNSNESPIEQRIVRLSESLWPWPERRLAAMVAGLAITDYVSTIGFLKLNEDKQAYEAGILASQALARGGLLGVLLTDVTAVGTLVLAALGIRYLCLRTGFERLARAAFVFMLVPYAAAAAGAIFNNIAIILL